MGTPMTMLSKSMQIEALDEAGKGLARIAVLSAIDHDGDTYLPGAFGWKAGGSQWAQILPAHDRWACPLGKARVYEEGDAAFAELFLNLDTEEGRNWHAALKFDLAKGNAIQEWSYGFDVLDADFEIRGDQRVRKLKKLDVHEVSPVLKGAGIGTRTIDLKGLKGAELKDDHFKALLAGLGELASALDVEAALNVLSAQGVKQLGDIHRAIGAALAPIAAKSDAERIGGDTALAQFLLHQSRAHLRG